MTRRTEQVASLIQKELGELMLFLELPTMTTISKVEVTPDLKHAKVWVTIFSNDKEMEVKVLNTLKENLRDLQSELNKKTVMKYTPRVAFVVDGAEQYASKINELLRKTHEDEEQDNNKK